MQIIDAWAQQPNELFLNQPIFDSLKRWTGDALNHAPTLEQTADIMQRAGVTSALLSAWHGPHGPLITNDEVLKAVKSYPTLFAGMVAVDLRNPVHAVNTLRHYVLNEGFKALRIVQWLWELPCTHPLYYPLYTECVNLHIPVCLQVGLTGPLHSSESGRPMHIERIALDFPDLTIVCGHIGYPWQNEMIAYATKFPNVYIDTSAYKPKRYPRELIDFMKTHGRKKVLFGTNYPMISPMDCVQELDVLGLDKENLNLFLYENAKRVFNI